MQVVSENKCFGGVQGVYSHPSDATGTEMTFGLFLPVEARSGPVPLLIYLSGLTCTHENAMVKSGAQAHAAAAGLALLFPDTSPRGEYVSDDDGYDLGQGAGFYVNATEDPWAPHFKMWDYIAEELPGLVAGNFPVHPEKVGITGHSMGGHGALTLAMTYPERFKSLSAFAPIANPTQSDWGRKQLAAYLGADEANWSNYDSSLLMQDRGYPGEVLIDQGCDDQFLDLLRPETLASAMVARRQRGVFRMQSGYDHSYFFMATFMADHIAHHAAALSA